MAIIHVMGMTIIQQRGQQDYGSWFFVLVTLSPTDVGALSAQFTQLQIQGPVPPSADSGNLLSLPARIFLTHSLNAQLRISIRREVQQPVNVY